MTSWYSDGSDRRDRSPHSQAPQRLTSGKGIAGLFSLAMQSAMMFQRVLDQGRGFFFPCCAVLGPLHFHDHATLGHVLGKERPIEREHDAQGVRPLAFTDEQAVPADDVRRDECFELAPAELERLEVVE